MGFLSNKLLEGTKNKCIDGYLSKVVHDFRFATNTGVSDSEKTLVNIHIEMATQFFEELDIFLRIKNKFPQVEIDRHFLDAESKALATACRMLNLDFDFALGLLSDKAYELAEKKYNKKLTYLENFGKVRNDKELSGKSVMWRHSVLTAFKYIEQQGSKQAKSIGKPVTEKINVEKVKKPVATKKATAVKPVIEIVNQDKVRKPGTSKHIAKQENIIEYEDFAKRAKKKSQLKKQNSASKRDSAWHFSVPINGWTWYCEYHDTYGLADDYDECLFMFGAHMHYKEIDGDVCEPHFKEWVDADSD
ncbi:MAG: hypothetical protein RLY76_46 [Actinomycetota bacterium]|jgi:hypothetical protein